MYFTESSTKDNKSEKAMFLGKWLWILFWLFIPGMIASIMVNENIASLFYTSNRIFASKHLTFSRSPKQ